jgi:hypothetical protein
MAKQSGIIKIEGTLDDLTFLKSRGKYFVRKKGGVSRNRIRTDAAFQRTRENSAEFAHAVTTSSMLRRAAGVFIRRAYDPLLNNRLMSVFFKIKNHDPVSARGARQVQIGLGTPEGKALLRGFDFNPNAKLDAVLLAPYVLTPATGVVAIAAFIPTEMLHYPASATHVSLSAGFVIVDFETGSTSLSLSNISQLAINSTETTVTLTPDSVPAGSGNKIHLLLIEFYQEVNGVKYALHDGGFNSLTLIEVN